MIHRFPFSKLAAVLTIVAMPFAAFAASPVGDLRGGGSSIEWTTHSTGHQSVRLVMVDRNGEVVVDRTYAQGRSIHVRVADLGTNPADGAYTYELTVTPVVAPAVAKKLAAARAANDEAAVRKIMRENNLVPVVQSGTVTLDHGSFVDPTRTEGTAAGDASAMREDVGGATPRTAPSRPSSPKVGVNDQVIADDLIVQGSECVGFDCVDGESFGFDTIKMKENNLRIKAEDTSTGTGFPTTDWQLTFNDSASGGANKFSVDDVTALTTPFTITGAAPTNSMFVASNGKVGFRTGTPVLDLHVTTGDTPAIRQEQTNASGFTAQTWDIGANEANWFVRDVTGGSRLPLRIRPGAPTSSLDINASGNVGVGTASPQLKMHVYSSEAVDANIGLGPNPGNLSGGPGLNIGYSGLSLGRGAAFLNSRPDASAVAPNPSLRFWTNDVQRILIDNEGYIALGDLASTSGNPTSPIHYTSGAVTARLTSAGVWQDNSSRAAKEHITKLSADVAFDALQQLEPVTYNYKVLPDDPKVGFIAEDVPALVASPERDGLSALDIVAVLTKVVQEQQKTIEQLAKRVDELQKTN